MSTECRLANLLTTWIKAKSLYKGAIADLLVSTLRESRIEAADVLLDGLVKETRKVQPCNRCQHALDLTPAPLDPQSPSDHSACSAHLVWPDTNTTRRATVTVCTKEQLLQAIDQHSAHFDAILLPHHSATTTTTTAAQVVMSLPDHVLVQLLLLIVSLAFRPVESNEQGARLQVESDFKQPFQGNGVDSLISYILHANQYAHAHINSLYAKSFPILQSSGSGKTKLTVQLSARQAGLLICVRSPPTSANSKTTSFPPHDKHVYEYFSETCKLSSSAQHNRIAAWIGAYFFWLAQILRTQMVASGCFDPSLQSLHPTHVTGCWNTIVYWLALAVHVDPDFIQDFSFFDDRSQPLELCPQSKLHRDHASYSDSFRQRNFGLDALPPVHADPTLPSLPTSTPPKQPSHHVSRFRTRLLWNITLKAKAMFASPFFHPPHSKPHNPSTNLNKSKPPQQTTPASDPRDLQSDTKSEPEPEPEPEEQAKRAVEAYVKPYLNDLERLLPKELRKHHFFFLAVDEVLDFNKLLPVFRRLWRESEPLYSWLMFIDTDSNIAHLAGDEVVAASERLGESEGKVIVPPFIYLPFDVVFRQRAAHLCRQLLDGKLTFSDMLDHLRNFGRPLWSTGLYSISTGIAHYKMPHLINVLRKLLINRLDTEQLWPLEGEEDRWETIVAALGQRLPLAFIGYQGARRFASDEEDRVKIFDKVTDFMQQQVSRHLRVISLVYNTEYFSTSTPSEPALSLAVASLFRGYKVGAVEQCYQRWSDSVIALAETHCSNGLMLGEEGEECVRMVCSMAADVVAAKRVEAYAQKQQQQLQEVQRQENDPALFEAQCFPICLIDWLDELLGSDNVQQPLRSWASQHYLNFTHFLELGETVFPGRLDPMLLVESWWRQAAFHGVATQPAWDLVIPIYHSPNHSPTLWDTFDPTRLSYVAIQVKNRHTSAKVETSFGPYCIYPPDPIAAATSSQGVKAAKTADELGPGSEILLRDECLEIWFNLRGPASTGVISSGPVPRSPEPKPTQPTEPTEPTQTAELASPDRDRDQDGNDQETVTEQPSPDGSLLVRRPCLSWHLTVNGSDTQVLPVIRKCTSTARKKLKVLFGFNESSLETKLRVLTQCTTRHVEIVRTTQVLQGKTAFYLSQDACASLLPVLIDRTPLRLRLALAATTRHGLGPPPPDAPRRPPPAALMLTLAPQSTTSTIATTNKTSVTRSAKQQQLLSLAGATATATNTAKEIATVHHKANLLSRIASWCLSVAWWLFGMAHAIFRLGCELLRMWHACFGYIWGLVVMGALLWVSKALFNLVSAKIFRDCAAGWNRVAALANTIVEQSFALIWRLSERCLVPRLRALGSNRLVQRWIEAFLEPSLVSYMSESNRIVYNSSNLLIESSSRLAITTATTTTAVSAVTAATAAMATTVAAAAAVQTGLTTTALGSADAATNGSVIVATTSKAVNASTTFLSSSSSSLTDAGKENRVTLIWTQPDLVQGCTQVLQSLLDEVLASSSETLPSLKSGSGLGSESLLLSEQIRQLQPRVKMHIDRHPECFQSKIDMILVGGANARSSMALIRRPRHGQSQADSSSDAAETVSQE
ncbi:hypothetical protein NDA16_000797 [Ustilago loliicola]|nr:hypothetical protein NDA16_000797 [Ustilago loliicola]